MPHGIHIDGVQPFREAVLNFAWCAAIGMNLLVSHLRFAQHFRADFFPGALIV
jgi:hypothetical protein